MDPSVSAAVDPAEGLGEDAFLGCGWGFPVVWDAERGDVAMVAHEVDIREAILLILETTPGERVMRPGYGVGLRSLVFEPLSQTLLALVKHRVAEALITYEPRIDVRDVHVTASPATPGVLRIDIGYTVRSTNTFYNLVYPFYLTETRA